MSIMWNLFAVNGKRCSSFLRRISSTIGGEEVVQKHRIENDSIIVNASNESEPLKVNLTWLRHHCRCPTCFNPVTYQRRVVPTKSIFEASKIEKLEFPGSGFENSITVHWEDAHKSSYDLEWLTNHVPKAATNNGDGGVDQIKSSHLKPRKSIEHLKSARDVEEAAIDYGDFMKNEASVAQFLRNIIRSGFGMVKNSPADDLDSISKVHGRICHPHRTFYGDGVVVATSDMKYKDTAYTSEPLPLHTDTTYFTESLGLQSFHVLRHEGTGGLSSFGDGFHAAELLYKENQEMYSVLSETPVRAEYYDPGKFHYSSLAHTFSHELGSGILERIRFNPLDMSALSQIHPDKVSLFYEAMIRFSELLGQNTLWFKLRPGTTLFIDNWRILHGRSGFTGTRSLASAYFPRSDWHSRARVLGALEH